MIEGPWIKADFDALMRDADRLDHLCRHVPRCTSCDTDQVQLLDRGVPASCRCRRCRHAFLFEPAGATLPSPPL